MRFRPSSGMTPLSKKDQREANAARAEAISDNTMTDRVYEQRHTSEIDRAENVAAGLPPTVTDDQIKAQEEAAAATATAETAPPPSAPPPQSEEPFKPVTVPEPARGVVDKITNAASSLVKKVRQMIRPVRKVHKEVVINSETLETRVAVLEDGKLEEFTIERTSDERLVGSIFKGRVRNLEDGLKAAFVDIGFEKNAFLHYWDIVPSNFDSSVEIVERKGKRRDRLKITQKDIPRQVGS